MKVHLNINPNIQEDEIMIVIKEMNAKVEKLLSIIHDEKENGVISLQREERIYLVEPKEISHVFQKTINALHLEVSSNTDTKIRSNNLKSGTVGITL